jgi:hypothetical protein
MQTDIQKIVSVSGQSGLYKYISQARHGIIVENIKDEKRTCIPPATKVSSLAEITIYTVTGDDLLLKEILLRIKDKTNGEKAISHKSSTEELMAYFEEIVPDYDRKKVYPHHVKKMIEWYNILQEYQLLDFEENKTEEQTQVENGNEIVEPENSSVTD